MDEFDTKKKSLVDVDAQQIAKPVFKARTKGKFADHVASGVRELFYKDHGNKIKANPLAYEQEM